MTYQLSPSELQQENHSLQAELRELRSRYESLQRSEARYQQIFENAPISMLCISTEGQPIEMNSAAEEFLGWTIAEAKKADFNGFTDSTLVENGTVASIERAIAGETIIEPPTYFDPSSTIGRGQWKWAQRHYYPIRDVAGQVQEIIEVTLDLTAMYDVQQKLGRERTSLLQASAQVANLLLRASDYTRVLPDVVRLLGKAVNSDRCGLFQTISVNTSDIPHVKVLPIEWCCDLVKSALVNTPTIENAVSWNNFREIYEQLVRGKPANFLVSALREPARTIFGEQGNTSMLTVPIIVDGALWGGIGFDNCGEPRLYDEAEIAILQLAAETMAAAIARQAKDEELRESEHRYRQLMDLAGEGIFRVKYEQPISVDLPVEEQAKQIYQQFRYAEHNLAFAQMYGYDQVDALVGTYLAHVTDAPENALQMEQFVQNSHRMRNQETVEIDRFGNKRYFLNNGFSIIRDGFAIGGWGTQIDITELRETQQALLEAEQARCLRLASQSQQLEHLNTELQQTLNHLEARDRILAATAKASNVLLTAENLDDAVNTALQIIGESINTDRICIVENFDNPSDPSYLYWKITYEWDSAYAISQINHPEVFQGSYEGIEEWYELFNKGQTISCQLEEMLEPFRGKMAKIGVKTFSSVPIFIEGKYWGNIGIDDCRKETHRSEAELSILKTAAACIGSAIERDRTQKAILQAEQERCLRLASQSQQLENLNTELQQTLTHLENRDRIVAATATATNILLTTENLNEAINKALETMGESLETDRIKVLENFFDEPSCRLSGYHNVIYEWTRPNTVRQMSHHAGQINTKGLESFIEALLQNNGFEGLVDEWIEPLRSAFKVLGVKSSCCVPIRVQNEWWGVLAFDDCREAKYRSQAEITVLNTIANCIGSAIERDRTQKAILQAEQERVAELAKTNQALKNSLDHLGDEPDLDAFLGHVLTETHQQLEIDLGYLLFYDPSDQTLDLHMLVTSEGTSLKQELQETNPFCKTFSVEDLTIWDTLLQTQKPFIIDRENAAQYVFRGTLAWQMQQQHHQAGINILLTQRDEPIGLLALVSTKHSFSPQQIELAQALAQQATLAIQLTRLAEEAKQSAIFEERNRLAGEIHDTLAQTFTGISVQLELAQYLSQHNPTEVVSILDRIGTLAQTGLAEARRSVWSVYPASEDYTDLAQKLTDCVTTLTEGTDLETQVLINGNPYPLSYFIGKNLLRIGQESITNTLKHAQATILLVELIYTPHRVSLRVSDNGCGFSPQAQTEGFGLAGISERSDRINGQLRITTQPGQGTEILVQVSL